MRIATFGYFLIAIFFVDAAIAGNAKNGCYATKSKNGQLTLIGCPAKGYRTRFDYAQNAGDLLLMVPSKYHADPNNSQVYIAVTPIKKGKHTLAEHYSADLGRTLSRGRTLEVSGSNFKTTVTSKIIKEYKFNLKDNVGTCQGAVVQHAKEVAHFSYDVFVLCEYKNIPYIGIFSMGALNGDVGKKELPVFLHWLKQPQIIKTIG